MLRKFLFSLIVSGFAFFVVVNTVSAQQPCVQVYGGGVVCGAATPEHKPVETGIGENLVLIGGGLILASGVVLYLSRKFRTLKS